MSIGATLGSAIGGNIDPDTGNHSGHHDDCGIFSFHDG